jgi:hypothetical protein
MLCAPLLAERGCVLGDHLRIHREAARGDDDRLRLHRTGFREVLPNHTVHGAVVDDEVRHGRLIADLHTEFVGALHQQVDDHRGAAELAGNRHRVAARRGLGLLGERPHLLIAGVGQTLGARWHHDLAGVETALELKPQVLQPVEVLDAAVAVCADLLVVGFG